MIANSVLRTSFQRLTSLAAAVGLIFGLAAPFDALAQGFMHLQLKRAPQQRLTDEQQRKIAR